MGGTSPLCGEEMKTINIICECMVSSVRHHYDIIIVTSVLASFFLSSPLCRCIVSMWWRSMTSGFCSADTVSSTPSIGRSVDCGNHNCCQWLQRFHYSSCATPLFLAADEAVWCEERSPSSQEDVGQSLQTTDREETQTARALLAKGHSQRTPNLAQFRASSLSRRPHTCEYNHVMWLVTWPTLYVRIECDQGDRHID